MAKWKRWKVDRVTCRPRTETFRGRCKVRLEWYPPGFDGKMAVRTVFGTRREITAAAGEVIASGYAAPAKWGAPAVASEAASLETIGQLLSAWLYAIEETAHGSDLSPQTHRTYRISVSRVVGPKAAPRLRNLPLKRWDTTTARAWTKREALRVSRSTHESDRLVLRAAWRWAQQQGYLDQLDPLSGMAWPLRWGGKRYTRYTPTIQEVHKTLALLPDTPASHRARVVLTVVWATGARIGEVCALRRSDLDLADPEDGWVILQGASEDTTGKGKGDRAQRQSPLNPLSVQLLRSHLATLPPEQERLWPGQLKRLTGSVRGVVAQVCKREGLPHWSPHGLRRLMVDDMIRASVDVATAAEITGHSVVTMLRKYRQVTLTDKRQAARQVRREGMKQRQVLKFPKTDEG